MNCLIVPQCSASPLAVFMPILIQRHCYKGLPLLWPHCMLKSCRHLQLKCPSVLKSLFLPTRQACAHMGMHLSSNHPCRPSHAKPLTMSPDRSTKSGFSYFSRFAMTWRLTLIHLSP